MKIWHKTNQIGMLHWQMMVAIVAVVLVIGGVGAYVIKSSLAGRSNNSKPQIILRDGLIYWDYSKKEPNIRFVNNAIIYPQAYKMYSLESYGGRDVLYTVDNRTNLRVCVYDIRNTNQHVLIGNAAKGKYIGVQDVGTADYIKTVPNNKRCPN